MLHLRVAKKKLWACFMTLFPIIKLMLESFKGYLSVEHDHELYIILSKFCVTENC